MRSRVLFAESNSSSPICILDHFRCGLSKKDDDALRFLLNLIQYVLEADEVEA